jgi:hypothetical protein
MWFWGSEVSAVQVKPEIIRGFGKWSDNLAELNQHYHNLGNRLHFYIDSMGSDPCGRLFNAEPLIDFAIETRITECTIDYIYRQYSFHLIAKYGEQFDNEAENERLTIDEFVLIPENKLVFRDKI